MVGLSLDNARELLESWARTTSWRRRGLAQSLDVTSFEEKSAYTVRLETHVEARRVTARHRPYGGGPVDGPAEPGTEAAGAEAGPETLARHPGDFVADIQNIIVPHTEVVRPCAVCGSTGREPCDPCDGDGRTTCTECWGHGTASRDGESSTCATCRGSGQGPCTYCRGAGRLDCTACLGRLELVHFDEMVLHYQSRTAEHILEGSELPPKLVAAASRLVAFREEAPRLEVLGRDGGGGPFRSGRERVNPRVNDVVNQLLEAERLADDERILKQRVIVESLPVYELDYRYRGDERRCWIYGHDQAVYAPNYPISLERIAATAIAAMTLLGAAYARAAGLF